MIRGRAAERPTNGRDLERAVAKAASHYSLLDRGELQKQHTPKTHSGIFIGKAPLDFKGWFVDHRGERPPCVIECKQVEHQRLDFEDTSGLKEHQLEAIRSHVARGIQTWLIIDIAPLREVYRVDGREIVEFAAAPWRSSLSLIWLRSHADIVKESERGHKTRHAVWWLDTRVHPERDIAGLAVAEEKARCEGRVVELYPAAKQMNQGASALDLRDMLASKPKHDASPAEQLAWRDRFSKWQLERDHREAKRLAGRAKTFGRRGRG